MLLGGNKNIFAFVSFIHSLQYKREIINFIDAMPYNEIMSVN